VTAPQRIQLRRTKGWRKPPGAVVVARPTVYGNPWTLRDAVTWRIPPADRQAWLVRRYAQDLQERGGVGEIDFVTTEQIITRLHGRDLACWCPLEDDDGQPVPCHADVLLALSNRDLA
jgi:hypothetical protein